MSVNLNSRPTESDLLQIAHDFQLSKKKCEDIILTIKVLEI